MSEDMAGPNRVPDEEAAHTDNPWQSPSRALGLTWKDLTVQVRADHDVVHENVLSQFNMIRALQTLRKKPPRKTILYHSHGHVKPGEMLLVVGRPGSGCTTLLNVLANQRCGYASVSGQVSYGNLDAADAKQFRGQIIISSEDEIFFPSLTVRQTIEFAARLKTPFQNSDGVDSTRHLEKETCKLLLRSMGIEHTVATKVGDEFIRGVSGGERKRVSIAECLTTRGSIYCWDNSTRGLDASTALSYVKAVRVLTDLLGLASVFTLYQAGNDIYNLFDKVLVLDSGLQIFYGPTNRARPFMEELGFVCRDGANIADFLTSVTFSAERQILPGYEKKAPRSAREVLERYERSPIWVDMQAEYGYPSTDEAKQNAEAFRQLVLAERNPRLPKKSPLTAGYFLQIHALVVRQYQVILGDKLTFLTKQLTVLVEALIAGSLFYDAPNTSAGLFTKSSALFFSVMFNTLLAMSEVTSSFTGRPVISKHRSFALFHPVAYCFAQVLIDLPVVIFQISIFSLILYFMVGLNQSAESFFIFWAILIATTTCMSAMFRAIGASFSTFDKATKVSGLVILVTVLYNGYMIPKPKMHPWFGWIFWVNPLAYAFNALMCNEFHDRVIPCVGPNLVPVGPGYNNSAYQSCGGVRGAVPNQDFILGENYLKSLSYGYGDLWRNFGIIWAWWALFVALTIYSTSNWRFSSQGGSPLRTPRERMQRTLRLHQDEEQQIDDVNERIPAESTVEEKPDDSGGLIQNTSVLTWRNLYYTVKVPNKGELTLLNDVQGWVKPGTLGALMGASGSGKTTLLDVLAQRKTEGVIKGSIQVDGHALPISFQRSAGYCEQFDIHEPYATVREALEFSALLRQDRSISRREKLKYVDKIMDLLELNEFSNTLIGTVGNGLSVEQRKRVTIGVELVSKPSILIFLDEPTSGLDGQSAYNIMRFLRKLADVGQAILVTIHQPSAQLFTQFNSLLLLSERGKTAYFGEIGENAAVIKDYFARNGAPCPTEANVAEYIIDVVSGSASQGKNWTDLWLASPEHLAVKEELDNLIRNASAKPLKAEPTNRYEFAMPLWDQVKIVTHRMNVSLFRNTDYINNKLILHLFCSLYNGFSFWAIGNSASDLQLSLFTVFNFIFVAPGVLNQLQPLFIERRNTFEAREKKSKTYSWIAFVSALILSEIPYLVVSGVIYFLCWYYTVGFPRAAQRAGSVLFIMLLYEFIYTGVGQFIAAYAPNPVFASLINPFVLGVLIMFCGVLVSYEQITTFWRYWLYWLNPFSYIMGGLLIFGLWDKPVDCADNEMAYLGPPNGTTCGEYLKAYLSEDGYGAVSRLLNPDDTSECRICPYERSNDYLRTLNLKEYSYGWRDAGIVALFVFSSYAMVFLLMKLRTKTSKQAQ